MEAKIVFIAIDYDFLVRDPRPIDFVNKFYIFFFFFQLNKKQFRQNQKTNQMRLEGNSYISPGPHISVIQKMTLVIDGRLSKHIFNSRNQIIKISIFELIT